MAYKIEIIYISRVLDGNWSKYSDEADEKFVHILRRLLGGL